VTSIMAINDKKETITINVNKTPNNTKHHSKIRFHRSILLRRPRRSAYVRDPAEAFETFSEIYAVPIQLYL